MGIQRKIKTAIIPIGLLAITIFLVIYVLNISTAYQNQATKVNTSILDIER
jgi:hypothetical protein